MNLDRQTQLLNAFPLSVICKTNGYQYAVAIPTPTPSPLSPISQQKTTSMAAPPPPSSNSKTKQTSCLTSQPFILIIFSSSRIHHPPTNTKPQHSFIAYRECFWLLFSKLLYFSWPFCYLCSWSLVAHQTFC